MKRFGLCSVTFRNITVPEIIKLAKENELSAIEWGSDIHVPETNFENAETVGKLTRAAGLACPSYGSYFRCGEKEDFERYSSAAEKLGAKTIRIWAGEKNAEDWSEEEYKRFIKRVRGYSETAKMRGQTVAFEYHHGTYNNSAEHCLQLLNDIDRDNVKTYWQPAYWESVKGEEAEEYNVRSIRLLKGSIENVHVYHWIGTERKMLSDGAGEWRRYVSEIGSAIYYLEFVKNDGIAELQADSRTLLSLTD